MNAHPRLCRLLLLLLPVTAWAESSFQRVILDGSYIAYERDVGDIDGDGDNDVVAVQEGDTALQVFRAPDWTCSTLVAFSGTHRYPRADDLKVADIDGYGDLDVVTQLGTGPSDDGAGIAVWCENLGHGAQFAQHLIGDSLEYVKDIVIADFDRDGRPDVAMRMDGRTQLWLQNSGGTWTEVLLTHPPREGMDAGDLDMDGDPDLILNGYWFSTPDTPAAARVAANYTNHVIDAAWFNQTGDWTRNSYKVVVGDFDGDGDLDLVSIAYDDSTRLHMWRNDSSPPGTARRHAVSSGAGQWGIVAATLGDGTEGDGTILLENRAIRVRYTAKRFPDGNKDHVITDFLVPRYPFPLIAGGVFLTQ